MNIRAEKVNLKRAYATALRLNALGMCNRVNEKIYRYVNNSLDVKSKSRKGCGSNMETKESWQNAGSLKDVVTEQEVIDQTGLSETVLYQLRHKGELPFIQINKKCRMYFVEDVMEFFKKKRVTD